MYVAYENHARRRARAQIRSRTQARTRTNTSDLPFSTVVVSRLLQLVRLAAQRLNLP